MEQYKKNNEIVDNEDENDVSYVVDSVEENIDINDVIDTEDEDDNSLYADVNELELIGVA